MKPTAPNMKEMLDFIQKKMETASYLQTIRVYDFIKALMREVQNEI